MFKFDKFGMERPIYNSILKTVIYTSKILCDYNKTCYNSISDDK